MLANPHCSLPACSILRPCGPALCRLCCGPLLGPRHPQHALCPCLPSAAQSLWPVPTGSTGLRHPGAAGWPPGCGLWDGA